MSKPTMVKCKCCKKELDKNVAYNPKPREYYCNEDCYNKSLVKKDKIVNKSDRTIFLDYIQSLYVKNGIDKDVINWGMVTKQISTLMKDNPSFNYKAMKYVLHYYYNICENEFNAEFGVLWIVEKFYNEAKQFYIDNAKRKKQVENYSFNTEEIIIKTNGNKLENKYKEIDFD